MDAWGDTQGTAMARLVSHGYKVFGVSKDSEKSHEKFIDKQELIFPLLMDEDGSIHEAFGTWRMKKNYGKEYMGCARSTFVIGEDGNLIFARYNVCLLYTSPSPRDS